MIRYTAYTILALVIALCAYWVSTNPGLVLITWQGWEVRFSLAVSVFLLILYTIAIWGLLRVLKWLNIFAIFKDPKRLAAKRKKAEQNLDLAWSAYALGDDKEAIKFGLRAKAQMGEENSVLRLPASATKRLGEEENPYLDKLEASSDNSVWVKKQKLDQLLTDRNWPAAEPMIIAMLESHPKNPTLLKLSFLNHARQGNWNEADAALIAAQKAKNVLTTAEAKRYRAVIDFCLALEEKAAGRKAESQKLIKSALKSDPSFSPAALAAAKSYIEQNDQKSAEKVLQAAWKHAPNSELAEILEELYPSENSTEALKRLKKIADGNLETTESAHLVARAAISAHQWPEAGQALQALINSEKATKTTYALLAELERKQKNDEDAASLLLERAKRERDDDHWRCGNCGRAADHYVPNCPHCGEFDQIKWTAT